MKKIATAFRVLCLSALLGAAVSCATFSAQKDIDAVGEEGYELLIAENYKAAQKRFEECTRLDKTRAEAWYCLGLCLLEQKKYAASAEASLTAADCFAASFSALREGEELHSFMGSIAYGDVKNFQYSSSLQVGEAYLLWGKAEKAFGVFQTVLDASPTDEERILAIATTCVRTGFVREAADFFEKNIRAHAQNHAALAPLYLYYAQCQMGLGNYETAAHALLVAREEKLKEVNWRGEEDFGSEKARGSVSGILDNMKALQRSFIIPGIHFPADQLLHVFAVNGPHIKVLGRDPAGRQAFNAHQCLRILFAEKNREITGFFENSGQVFFRDGAVFGEKFQPVSVEGQMAGCQHDGSVEPAFLQDRRLKHGRRGDQSAQLCLRTGKSLRRRCGEQVCRHPAVMPDPDAQVFLFLAGPFREPVRESFGNVCGHAPCQRDGFCLRRDRRAPHVISVLKLPESRFPFTCHFPPPARMRLYLPFSYPILLIILHISCTPGQRRFRLTACGL